MTGGGDWLRRVVPNRRRTLVAALTQLDGESVVLTVYWNRAVEEARGTLDAAAIEGGSIRLMDAVMTIHGDVDYRAEDLSIELSHIRWVVANGARSGPY